MNPDSRTKKILLIAAASILISALIWLVVLESTSYVRKVCSRINSFGYHISPSDLYSKSYSNGSSLSSILEEDLTEAVSCSSACGFGADTEKTGRLELLLWNMDEERVMVIWLVDREPELVFIENSTTGEITPIG